MAILQRSATQTVASESKNAWHPSTSPRPMNLKRLEHFLPPSPPLAGRWMRYRCTACGQATLLDLRVRRLPGVSLLVRRGWATLACRACGGTALTVDGLVVS